MIISSEAILKQIAIHSFVNGRLEASQSLVEISDYHNFLTQFFFKPFSPEERFCFSLDNPGEVLASVQNIFTEPSCLLQESQKIGSYFESAINRELYQDGEFIACLFEDCVLDNEVTDVLGIFKIENKEPFLTIQSSLTGFELSRGHGIGLNKLEKGVLIFNIDADIGYQCLVVDKQTKSAGQYEWKEKFLCIERIKDNYFQTQHLIQNIQEFAQNAFEAGEKSEQISMINDSIDYIQKNELFDKDSYSEEVLKSPDLIERFENFTEEKQAENPEQPLDQFEISQPAVKKSKRYIRSVIKLDKNFHLYVHGNREHIIRGFDPERKKHFYTLYFDQEN